MPFQQRSPIVYAWERAAGQGQEFCKTITAKVARDNWTRVLKAIPHGVLVIRHYQNPVGVLASPIILRDLSFAWYGLSAKAHPTVEPTLTALCQTTLPSTDQPFGHQTLSFRSQPTSVVRFLAELNRHGNAALVEWRSIPRAVLMPLPVLARLYAELPKRSPWSNEVVNWISYAAERSA